MKVMKFGGISLGTSDAIEKVKDIIGAENQPIVIVVSALHGVTEQLLEAANHALNNDKTYKTIFDNIQNYHNQIIEDTIEPNKLKKDTLQEIQPFLDDLRNILRGVFLIGDLSQKTSDKIVSYGER
ncbi:MAG: bifunctional aspartate kinase/homoserine dehydrogenase I, partial [Bacteroidales bacterium]|nr:bifunctional aspartate kinase/homoserine dehydrogenase I [Bacteroidales bacterium]